MALTGITFGQLLRTRIRLAACVLVVAAVLAGSYLLYIRGTRTFRRKFWHVSGHLVVSTTSEPYTEFIDPAAEKFRRKFYSWNVINPDPKKREAQTQNLQSGVTVFLPRDSTYDRCVPYLVPGNLTTRICIYNPEEDRFISSHVRDLGSWEPDQVEAMAYLMRSDVDYKQEPHSGIPEYSKHVQSRAEAGQPNAASPSKVGGGGFSGQTDEDGISLVDIGCNIGVYALAATTLGYQVLAVDPVEDSLQLLTDSLRLNNLTARATLLLNAVSDVRGPVVVKVNSENRGGSSVHHARLDKGDLSASARGPVRAVCLDDLLAHVRTRRVFLKLDIEGFEERVLRCAGLFFQQVDVRGVLMEWVFHRKGKGGAAIIEFMTRNGLLPYSHAQNADRQVLLPGTYFDWPDNVLWIKR